MLRFGSPRSHNLTSVLDNVKKFTEGAVVSESAVSLNNERIRHRRWESLNCQYELAITASSRVFSIVSIFIWIKYVLSIKANTVAFITRIKRTLHLKDILMSKLEKFAS